MISRGVSSDGSRPLDYMPQLDSLRTVAVAGVFFYHFLPPGNAFRDFVAWGDEGVRLFFVLSGFLITGILLSCRQKVDAARLSPWRGIRNFYIRRFLRLFPLYYLYLAAGMAMLPVAWHYAPYFLFYSQNFLFAIHRDAVGTMTHFWSLAIEEQFYLTWPWLVIFLPRRWLVPVLGGIVLAGPAWRAVALAAGVHDWFVTMMMPAHFDTLGMGGLLAVLAGSSRTRRWADRLMRTGLWLGGTLMVVHAALWHFRLAPRTTVVLGELASGLFYTWVIGRAATGFAGPAGRFLNWRVPIYLGGISYGIYVIHFHVPGVLRDKVLPRLGLSMTGNAWADFAIYAAISVGLAAVSWRFFEGPINGLKRHFPYAAGRTAAEAAAPAAQPETAPRSLNSTATDTLAGASGS